MRYVSFVLRSLAVAIGLNCSIAQMVSGGELFWSQDGGVWRGHSDGTGAHQFVPAFDSRGVAVSGWTLLWSDIEPRVPITPTGGVRAVEFDGTDQRDVAINLASPEGMDVDAASGMVYWSDTEQDAILRTRLDAATEVETILADVPTVAYIHDVAIDPQARKVYFGYVNPLLDGLFAGAIGRVDFDGSELETVVSGLSEPWGVTVDPKAGKVYWTDVLLGRGGLIRRAGLDGADMEDVVDGLQEPRGIALDAEADQVYWVDLGTNKVQRADANGGNAVDVFTNLDRPQALAFSPVPEPSSLILLAGGAVWLATGLLFLIVRRIPPGRGRVGLPWLRQVIVGL